MIQNEQILEYIDGLLGPEAEQSLFDAMARQPELRSALRQFIVIGDAVRADREAYTPPSDVERALMNGLGLGSLLPHAAIAGGAAASGAPAGLFSFAGRFWGMMLSFLLGALLAGSSVAYVMTDSPADAVVAGKGTPEAAASRDVASTGTAPGSPAAGDPVSGSVPQSGGADLRGGGGTGAPMMNGGASGSGSGIVSSRRDGPISASQRARSDRSGSVSATANNRSSSMLSSGRSGRGSGRAPDASGSPDDAARSSRSREDDGSGATPRIAITPVKPRATDLREGLTNNELPQDAPSRAPQEFLPVSPAQNADAGDRTGSVALEGRMNLGGAYQPNNALRSPSPTDDLMGAGFVHLTSSFALGAEFGKESYDQTLYSVSAETLQVEQRPSYAWLGVTGRLYLGELPLNGIETFVQGTAAYSTGGPIMRLRLGGRMPLASALDLTFGVETAGLIYTFQDRQSVSGRWGLSGGVQWTLW